MESDRRKIEEAYLKAVDIGYSYHLAKKMEEFKSNPVFGYRTAGSKAEFDTGEFLKEEMERIGLSDIHKDELCLDSWEFEKAVLRFADGVCDGWMEGISTGLRRPRKGSGLRRRGCDGMSCDGGHQPER